MHMTAANTRWIFGAREGRVDAISGILDAFRTHQIVALGEAHTETTSHTPCGSHSSATPGSPRSELPAALCTDAEYTKMRLARMALGTGGPNGPDVVEFNRQCARFLGQSPK
jgi:hypothetical protein